MEPKIFSYYAGSDFGSEPKLSVFGVSAPEGTVVYEGSAVSTASAASEGSVVSKRYAASRGSAVSEPRVAGNYMSDWRQCFSHK